MATRFFQALERRFGRFADLREPASVGVIETRGRLQTGALTELLEHRALAVVVRGWYPREAAEALGAAILASEAPREWKSSRTAGRGLESTDVQSALGVPLNMAAATGGAAARDEYLNEVRERQRQRRARETEIETDGLTV